MSSITKRLYTLNVDNYPKEITDITYPFIKYWANKIGAEFYIISERKFPGYPRDYEKIQIYDLAREGGHDWNIYIDGDAIMRPETPDWTFFLPKNVIAHFGLDLACARFRPDHIFKRDGRNHGSANWLAFGSNWCLDLWHPLEDISLEEAVDSIRPTARELEGGTTREHLITDYTLSRNIARYGLKATTIMQLSKEQMHRDADTYFFHQYSMPLEQKITELKERIKTWKLEDFKG